MKKCLSSVLALILAVSFFCCSHAEEQRGVNAHQYVLNYYSHLRTLYALNKKLYDYSSLANASTNYADGVYMIDSATVSFDENGTVTKVTWLQTDDPAYSVFQIWSLYAAFESGAMIDSFMPAWAYSIDKIDDVLNMQPEETAVVGDYEITVLALKSGKAVMFTLK